MLVDAKLFQDPNIPNVVFATIAENSGIPLFEPSIRFIVGIGEFLTALLLLLPYTRRFGAFLSFCTTVAALMFHLSPWLGVEVPLVIGSLETDGGQLFNLAMAMTAAGGLLMFIHPKKQRRRF